MFFKNILIPLEKYSVLKEMQLIGNPCLLVNYTKILNMLAIMLCKQMYLMNHVIQHISQHFVSYFSNNNYYYYFQINHYFQINNLSA